MASWSIHLALAKKINRKLKLNKDLFYYGNLIPDVDYNNCIKRYESHFYDEIYVDDCKECKLISTKLFLKKYKNNLNNPLIIGYYSHLLTDNYYNNIIYSLSLIKDNEKVNSIKLKNGKIIDLNKKKDKDNAFKRIKHKDLELYGKYLYNNNKVDLPKNINQVLSNINVLKPKFLNKELVEYRFNYFNNDFIKLNKYSLLEKINKDQYKLFTKKQYDLMFNDCCSYVLEEIKKIIKV